MFHQVRRLCTAALVLVGAPLLTQAQTLGSTDASVRFVDGNDNPLPPDFVTLRNSEGHIVVPLEGPNGSYLFSNVTRKVKIEFSPRGLKQQSIDLVLEESPVGQVWLTMMVDPTTGNVKYLEQKPVQRHVRPGKKIRNVQNGNQHLGGAPANDNCADAIPISNGLTAFSTIGATTDGNAHAGGCQFDGQTYNDIWFTYSADCTGNLTVETCGIADYDTDLVVYDGIMCTPGDAEVLGCNDDTAGCSGFTSRVTVPVVAGNGYLIRVGGFADGDVGTGMLSVACVGVGGANNDECATAPEVDCSGSVTFNNSGNTNNPADPDFSCIFNGPGPGVGSAWYQFVATSADVTIDTEGSAVSDTVLAAYSGMCGSLTEIGCSDDEGTGLLSTISLTGLTVGNTYYIQVASFSASSLGSITLNLDCGGGPGGGGDDCADPLMVPCNGSVSWNNSTFVNDPMDPDFSCIFGGPGPGAGNGWVTFVATTTQAVVDTEGSADDTVIAVYDGTCGSFTELACDDDSGSGLLSMLTVSGLTVGNTYYIQASSFSDADRGDITLNVTCIDAIDNDDCADAIALGMPPAAVSFDTTGATTDSIDAPCGVASGPFNNVWYSVTGTGNTLTASTCNPGTLHSDTKISVFCGDCGMPICVGGNDDDPAAECTSTSGFAFLSKVSWCSQPGVEYLVTVGGFSEGQVGAVELTIDETGGACVADVQCLAQGACCLADGSCIITTGDDCAAQGGQYFGDGSSCFSNAIVDGSFEAGAFSGNWTEFSTNFGTPLCDPGSCGVGGGTGPNSGDWWAWFGGIAAFEQGSVEQSVTIPATASTIDFAWEIPVASGNGVDFVRLLIDGMQVFELLESDSQGVGYTSESVALGAFADGGVHTVRFESTITGDDGFGTPAFTNFFIDDVSIASQDVTCEVPPTCFTLDFSTEDDFATALVDGQHINTEFGNLVSLSSTGMNAGMGIFDSSNPGPNNPSQDLDLLTNTGNILILQTTNFPPDGNDIFPVPNDDDDGGSVTFAFASAVAPMSVDLIDVDGSDDPGSVVLTDGSGNTRTYSVPANWTGDLTLAQPGIGTLDLTTLAAQPGFGSNVTASEDMGFDGNNVVSIVVNLGGSGGIDNLSWCEPE